MDIVEKLRSYSPNSGYSRVMREAADEIELLRGKLEVLHLISDLGGSEESGVSFLLPQPAVEEWRCVWCNISREDPNHTRACNAPDGDGHLFQKSVVKEDVG